MVPTNAPTFAAWPVGWLNFLDLPMEPTFIIPYRIHVTGIFYRHIWLILTANVGNYSSSHGSSGWRKILWHWAMDSSRNSVESRSDLTVGSVRIGNGEFCKRHPRKILSTKHVPKRFCFLIFAKSGLNVAAVLHLHLNPVKLPKFLSKSTPSDPIEWVGGPGILWNRIATAILCRFF